MIDWSTTVYFTYVLMGIYLPPASPSSLEGTEVTEEERNTITGIIIGAAIEMHREAID